MKTKRSFTNEEAKILRGNRYTAYVSSSTIRFTLEFKQYYWEQSQQGTLPSRIFQDAGYDVDLLGQPRIKNFAKRVREEANSRDGLHEGYCIHQKHPNPLDYGQMAPEEAQAAMQTELLYLRQELEFIKKIIKLDSTGGQKP